MNLNFEIKYKLNDDHFKLLLNFFDLNLIVLVNQETNMIYYCWLFTFQNVIKASL